MVGDMSFVTIRDHDNRSGVDLLKKIPITISLQNLHLLDSYLIEFNKPFALWYSVVDKHGIDILHIRQAYQFVNSTVLRLRIQFAITPLGSVAFFCLTMSVMLM